MTFEDAQRPRRRWPIITDAVRLRQSIYQALSVRAVHRGQIAMPCIPAPLDHYLAQLREFFRNLGKTLSDAEVQQLRDLLAETLHKGFQSASGAKLLLQYELTASPNLQKNLACSASISVPSVADEYKGWTETRGPALFGRHADARVMSVLEELGPPAESPVLDVGAGTGRNTLPLAQRGHPVDALELTPEFADQLQTDARRNGLPVRVSTGDVLDRAMTLPTMHYRLAVVSEVISHFRDTAQLRLLLERMVDCLAPGGLLLMNLFLADEGYEPDAFVREMSQVSWSYVYTRRELAEALAGLPLRIEADDSVVEYEQAHLPSEAWPPTGWFVTWATGRSVFPLASGYPPLELRWIVCRRT